MVKISRLLKDHRNTGTLHSLLALWGFVDERTFLTKAGAVGVVFRMDGVDPEGLDHARRRAVVQQFEQALRLLDERFRVYQYLLKRHAPPLPHAVHDNPFVHEALERRASYLESKAHALYTFETYLVIVFESRLSVPTFTDRLGNFAHAPVRTAADLFSVRRTTRILSHQLTRASAELQHHADAFVLQMRDSVKPRPLGKAEAFHFFRRLVNYAPGTADRATLKYDTHLDFFMADSAVECHREHLQVDAHRVKVLTMKEPPARTFAYVLRDLYAVPAPFIACLEWQRIPDATMRRDLHTRRRHFFNRKVALVNYVSPQTKPEEMLVDDSASAVVNELGACLTDMEVGGHFFGACSLTIVLPDTDAERLERSAASCAKVFAAHDGALYDERINLLNAWLAMVPGNGAHNLRRLSLLETNAADLSFLFTVQQGEPTSAHLGARECLAVLETEHATPYYFNLHVHDVGHTLVLGATGSGKSFLMNFLLTHGQKYDPMTLVFDLGGGYQRTVAKLGGHVWRIGFDQREVTINPFSLPATPEHRHFLVSFVRVLLTRGGDVTLTTADDREVVEAVENVYSLDAPQRRLSSVAQLLSRRLADRLHRWVEGGVYADVFDNPTDTLTFQRIQGFDFEGLERYPLVLEPLLFYILHRASAVIRADGAEGLKLFLLDEAWRFAIDPTIRSYLREALKTWRKANASVILATQSVEDFADTELVRTVVESCPTTLFLANPGMDAGSMREVFHLNDAELELLAGLRPRQQCLLKRPDHAKVLNLHVDPESYWLYTNTPPDTVRLRHAKASLDDLATDPLKAS